MHIWNDVIVCNVRRGHKDVQIMSASGKMFIRGFDNSWQVSRIYRVHHPGNEYYVWQEPSLLLCTPLQLFPALTAHELLESLSLLIEIECIVNLTVGTSRALLNCWWWKFFAQQVNRTSLSIHLLMVMSLLRFRPVRVIKWSPRWPKSQSHLKAGLSLSRGVMVYAWSWSKPHFWNCLAYSRPPKNKTKKSRCF